MTIILDKCAHISNTINIYSDSMYICTWGNFSHVSTILPLYMAELFWGCGNISYLCYQSSHEWLKTYWQRTIGYLICYVEIYTNYIEYQIFSANCSLATYIIHTCIHVLYVITLKKTNKRNIHNRSSFVMFLNVSNCIGIHITVK
jgi:hypothetical protein